MTVNWKILPAKQSYPLQLLQLVGRPWGLHRHESDKFNIAILTGYFGIWYASPKYALNILIHVAEVCDLVINLSMRIFGEW